MNARTLVVIMVFVAWAAASLYFTIAGCDSSEDCAVAYLPAPHALTPDENAYTAIKEFADNLPSNRTPLSVNYRLRLAYLNGTTNRLALADEALAFIAAESNTIGAAERILAAKGIDVPFEEVLTALPHCCNLMRIAHVYKVKATYPRYIYSPVGIDGYLSSDGKVFLVPQYSTGRSANRELAIPANDITALSQRIPDPPTTDGTYRLTVTVSGGVPTFTWTS